MKELLARTDLIDARCRTSVCVNLVWHHASQLGGVLSQYSEPLLEYTEVPLWEIRLRGTATLVKYNGHYLALVCKHQIAGCNIEKMVLQSVEPHYYITSGGYVDVSCKGDEKIKHDFCVFDFSLPVRLGKLSPHRFFDLKIANIVGHGDRVVGGVIYGYASQDQLLEADETGEQEYRLLHLGLRKREIVCTYAGCAFDDSAATWTHRIGHDFLPSGLSGSPVFSLIERFDDFYVKFAGIVVLGGREILHAIKGDAISEMLSLSPFARAFCESRAGGDARGGAVTVGRQSFMPATSVLPPSEAPAAAKAPRLRGAAALARRASGP